MVGGEQFSSPPGWERVAAGFGLFMPCRLAGDGAEGYPMVGGFVAHGFSLYGV